MANQIDTLKTLQNTPSEPLHSYKRAYIRILFETKKLKNTKIF